MVVQVTSVHIVCTQVDPCKPQRSCDTVYARRVGKEADAALESEQVPNIVMRGLIMVS